MDRLLRTATETVSRHPALGVGLVVAGVATGGSLFYSLGLGLVPCRLCWYQRVLMYPLVGVFAYAILADHPGIWRLALPTSVAGAAVAGYQSWLQVTAGSTCTLGGCAAVQYRLWGVLTIPNQSALAFLGLVAATGWLARQTRTSSGSAGTG